MIFFFRLKTHRLLAAPPGNRLSVSWLLIGPSLLEVRNTLLEMGTAATVALEPPEKTSGSIL